MMLSYCDSCGRHARYHIREHADGASGYEVSIFGGDAEPSEIISKRIPSARKAEISKEFDRVIAKHKRFVYKWKKGGTE